jgi:hypothetical protein
MFLAFLLEKIQFFPKYTRKWKFVKKKNSVSSKKNGKTA